MKGGGERRKRWQGELNVCKLNIPRLYLAREFKSAREEATRSSPQRILSNKATRSRIKERGDLHTLPRIQVLFSENRDYKSREAFVLDALCI